MSATFDGENERLVHAVVGRFMDAWNAHDAHAFAAVFCEDADFTNVLGMHARGRHEIDQFHAPRFADMFRNSQQVADSIMIRFVRSDVAAVDVRWSMTGAEDRVGNPIPLRKGLLNFIMTKDSEGWSIAVMHNLDTPPGPSR